MIICGFFFTFHGQMPLRVNYHSVYKPVTNMATVTGHCKVKRSENLIVALLTVCDCMMAFRYRSSQHGHAVLSE